mmetsp:Transcript_46067/g.76738  ORF Transcript_46067/g.76738 Transcript_46067/m.76738 type:complete len:109 (+) Transcript_46067:345-671(+)
MFHTTLTSPDVSYDRGVTMFHMTVTSSDVSYHSDVTRRCIIISWAEARNWSMAAVLSLGVDLSGCRLYGAPERSGRGGHRGLDRIGTPVVVVAVEGLGAGQAELYKER